MSWRERLERDMDGGILNPEDGMEQVLGPKEGGAGMIVRETGGGIQTKPDGTIEIMAGANCGMRFNPATGRVVILGSEIITTSSVRRMSPGEARRDMLKELEKSDERRTFKQTGDA